MQNTTHTVRTDDAPNPAAAESERLPAVMPWGPAYPPAPMIYETTSLLRLVSGRGGFDG